MKRMISTIRTTTIRTTREPQLLGRPMKRAFNFSAGPAALPLEVLQEAAAELYDYRGTGMSVMEMSHRSDEFVDIARRAEADLRELLAVPDDYAVLFLQGGATAQFAAVPLNLLGEKSCADHVDTGAWAKKAIEEAQRYCRANVVASSKATKYDRVPARSEWKLDPNAAYVHIIGNETIGGVEYHEIPEVGGVPLVSDMSSTLLSRPIDVTRFGAIYAGAQKNIGPAGLVLVIVRRDLLGRARADTPSILDWTLNAESESMYNTPATYSWYIAGLVFKWIKRQGGLTVMEQRNRAKAQKLYRAIDNSNFYHCPVVERDRSLMNVTFTLADESLDKAFVKGADAAGMQNLKGHRSVGGMRASIYNAVPEAAVDALIEYMADFETEHR
jgi:phosphoserine aminotransferase